MPKGSYYRTIDKNRLEQRRAWRIITCQRIERLNTLTDNGYVLAFRGRNHRVVLMELSHTIAVGMYQINAVLELLERRYIK